MAVFDDQGVSGSLVCERRPAMKSLLRTVTRREVDMVTAWAVDRWASCTRSRECHR
jgi:hypothetical protein